MPVALFLAQTSRPSPSHHPAPDACKCLSDVAHTGEGGGWGAFNPRLVNMLVLYFKETSKSSLKWKRKKSENNRHKTKANQQRCMQPIFFYDQSTMNTTYFTKRLQEFLWQFRLAVWTLSNSIVEKEIPLFDPFLTKLQDETLWVIWSLINVQEHVVT